MHNTAIMGVLNMTPDSFSDGGLFLNPDQAMRHAEQMIKDGADIIDIGGQSTRPGATLLPPEEEWLRIKPVVSSLASQFPVSIDTFHHDVMQSCLDYPVKMINDVSALPLSKTRKMLSETSVDVVLMHKQGQPQVMQENPIYHHVLNEVTMVLNQQFQNCLDDGIAADRIWVDPGIGFGKTMEHNSTLLKSLPKLCQQFPKVMLGISRKSYFRDLLSLESVEERVLPSAVVAAIAVMKGVRMIRTHDVAVTRQALMCAEVFSHE